MLHLLMYSSEWTYLILSALCKTDLATLASLQNIRFFHITKTLLFSNGVCVFRCCKGKWGGVRRLG